MIDYTKFEISRMTSKKIVKKNYNYIKQYLEFIGQKKANKISVILDIGANVGVYSVCFSCLFPNAKIYAFEPVKTTFNYLVKHISAFNLQDRVKCFNIGFWNSKCMKSLGFPENRAQDISNIGLYSVHGTEYKVDVQMEVLDEWIQQNMIIPDIIKMDAEGSEYNIIAGGSNTIKKSQYLICEENDNYNGSKIRSLLSDEFELIPKFQKGDKFWVRKEWHTP